MTKFYKTIKLSLLALTLVFGKAIAQPCYSPSSFGTANISAFTGVMTNINTCTYAGEYNTLNITVGGIYTFSVTNPANYLTLSTAPASGSVTAGLAPITVTLTPGTYYLHVAISSTCGTNSLCQTTSYSNTAMPGSPTVITSPSNTMVCSGSPAVFTASATGASTLQWQSSTSPTGPWTNVVNTPPFSGANTQTLTISPTNNTLNATYYQLVATNSVSGVSSSAAMLTVIQSTTVPLIEDFNASTTFPLSWINSSTNPYFVQANHGTAGSNGMTRNLFSTIVLADAQTPNTGVITSSTTLKFDYRYVEYSGFPSTATPTTNLVNDSLNIYISTNCGATFTLLGSINAANHIPTTAFTSKSYNLAPYAGSSAIIRFRANRELAAPTDYYIDIDNINISNVVPLDGGITALSQPAAGQPCYGSSQPVVVTISNFGTATLTSVPVQVNVSGALTNTINGTFTGSIPPSGTATFNVGSINMSAAGTYSLKAFTKILGDPTFANDTLLPVITRTVVPTGTLPYSEPFTGLTAPPAAWNTSVANPWFVQMNHGTGGSEGLTRNLYSTQIKAETTLMPLGLVTASTALSFDYRYQDWSGFPSSPATPTASLIYDTLAVRVSTNCGLTYSVLASISGTNHIASTGFANKTYSLGAYAGSNVVLRITATKTPSSTADYYIDVDNINLFNLSAIDGGVSALVTPGTSTCTSASQPVVVTITNYGLGPISNIPVSVVLSGAATQTISSTYTGTLAVGASVNYTVGSGNFSAGGTYTLTSSTNLGGDGNNLNNTNISTFVTANPVVSIVGSTVSCIGSSITLNTSGTASSYTWNTGATTNSISISPTVTTSYSVIGTNSLSCSATNTFTVAVINPTINTVGSTGCGAPANGTLTANAFATSTVNWYATSTPTGTPLSSGNTYTLSSPSTTTVYAQATSQSIGFVGLTNTAVVSGGGQQTSTNYNIFDVLTPCVIQNVEVYPGAAGNVVIDLRDNVGALITTATFSVGAVSSTVLPINFSVPVGNGYRLGQGAGSVSMYRTSAASNIYPLTLPGVITITNSAAGNTFYYFCYNWQVMTQGCTSPVTPVVFTVTQSASVPAVASNTAVCAGSSSTLTANGATSYTWNPGNLTGSVVVVSPTVATTYTVLGGSGSCTGTAVQALTVNPSPSVAVSPSQTICAGTLGVVTLTTASTGNTFTWSPGNSNNSTIVVPTPSTTTIYSVTATHPQGCRTTVTTTLTVQNCASVNEKSIADNTLIYPNPTNGLIHVSLVAGMNNCTIEIFDVTGRLVKSALISQAQSSLDLKDFANGLYTYKVKSAEKAVIKEGKIVKE